MRNNLKMYQKVNLESSMKAADPHTVILMLFNGVLESISVAIGAIERKDFEIKSKSLSKAINILRSLQHSLDKDSEPEVSKNFDVLYSYCINKLTKAGVSLELSDFDEVITMIKPLRDAWKNMPEQGKQDGIVALTEKAQSKVAQTAEL